MFDDLDKETPVEAAKSQASDDVASKLLGDGMVLGI